MNFNQLKYIVAIDKHRNFSRAAEECGIAQSTLSREVQRLEQEFDILIFDRSRYPVKPTMKGIDLIRQANEILEGQRKFEEIARQMVNRPSGRFRLGVLTTLAPYLLPLFIQKISDQYPELSLEISELTASEMIPKLEEGKIDGAIAFSPFIKEGFYESALFDAQFVLYMGEQHPLLAYEAVDWENIDIEELILHDSLRNDLFEHLDKVTTINLENIDYRSGSLETIRKIIDRNGGITILPRLACLYMGDRRIKLVRSLKGNLLQRKVSFITPRGFEKNRITKVIKQEVKSAYHMAIKELRDRI